MNARRKDAKAQGVLLSLHLKATMMKVSDPIMFGHAVRVYYKDVFDKHAALFEKLGVEPNNGIGDVYVKDSGIAGGAARRDRERYPGGLQNATRSGDGRFRQRHHQPARAQQRHH